MTIVTLTTDFGLTDGYAGIMHGVIRSFCRDVAIVDLSHQVSPQNVPEAAYLLYAAYPYFPTDTVHCVVVDPGVGTTRRAVAVATAQGRFVAPDNGVLSYVLACNPMTAAVNLTDSHFHLSPVSHTFHGRDIFAPVAAHLASGIPLTNLGQPISKLITIPVPHMSAPPDNTLVGKVIHVDRFGNLVTSIGRLLWRGDELLVQPAFSALREEGDGQWPLAFSASKTLVHIADQCIESIQPTYGDAPQGQLLALVGSAGHLEIAVAGGNAAEALGAGVGVEAILEIERR